MGKYGDEMEKSTRNYYSNMVMEQYSQNGNLGFRTARKGRIGLSGVRR